MITLEAARDRFVRALATDGLEPRCRNILLELRPRDARVWVAELVAILGKLNWRAQCDIAKCLAWFQTQRPGIMEGLYKKVVEQQCFWSPSLFHGADAAARDRLLTMIDREEIEDLMRNRMVQSLVWIGDKTVIAQLLKWRGHQPKWRSQFNIDTHDFARGAGWELTKGGKRRDLFLPECFELVATNKSVKPVDAITPGEGVCRWCQSPLITVLEVDLADKRSAFLDVRGTKLRIGLCINCVGWATIFTRVDRKGGFSWHPANKEPSIILPESDRAGPPTFHQFRLGKKLKSPIENHVDGSFLTSQIGGLPAWVNDAAFPVCPDCRTRMPAIAQIKTEDLEGPFYVYLCRGCNVAAVNYDQT